MSGYTHCACRDCFDIAVSSDTRTPVLCSDCKKAGCDSGGESECERSDAYDSADCSCSRGGNAFTCECNEGESITARDERRVGA